MEQGQIGLSRVGLGEAGLDWMKQGWIGWSRVRLDDVGLDQIFMEVFFFILVFHGQVPPPLTPKLTCDIYENKMLTNAFDANFKKP